MHTGVDKRLKGLLTSEFYDSYMHSTIIKCVRQRISVRSNTKYICLNFQVQFWKLKFLPVLSNLLLLYCVSTVAKYSNDVYLPTQIIKFIFLKTLRNYGYLTIDTEKSPQEKQNEQMTLQFGYEDSIFSSKFSNMRTIFFFFL